MQPSCGMIFIFLLVRLQWNKSNTEGKTLNETNTGNSSVRDSNQSSVQPTSDTFVPPMTTAINPSTVSHAAPTITNVKENVTIRTEMSGRSNSPPPRTADGTTLSSNVMMVSKGGTNNSVTKFNRIPMSLATFATTSDLSGVTKSAVATSTSTATPSNSTVTYSTPSTAVFPSDNSSINPTTITLTSPTVKQDSPTLNFNPIQQTTEQNHKFSNPSTASPNSQDANEEKRNKGGVIVGVIVGTILGSILIGLIGYFICGKKRSESFSHRRLYDDTRNDPGNTISSMSEPVQRIAVLHLENSLGPYDNSFGCASDDKTSTADKAEEDNAGCASDGIPMADIIPSHPSP